MSDAPHFDATLAAFAYRFPVDRLVQRFKYCGELALADWCAEALQEAVFVRHGANPPVDCIVALPLSPTRQRERGFNQSHEIARRIAARAAIHLIDKRVTRVKAGPPQAELPWAERARNVKDAFACAMPLKDLRIAVVDDVMTTGASLNELARTLKRAGAAHVENWIVARTLPSGQM